MRDAPAEVLLDVDVLVVGGGFAGAWAALGAADEGANVLLVEKGTVARSGASTMSGGVTTAPLRGDDLEKWVEELVVLGGYEANQDWTRALIEDQLERVADLDSWGVPIVKDDHGNIKRIKSRGMLEIWCCQYSPRHAMETLRARATAGGARILDKVEIVELLTSDGLYPTCGSVVGAIGMNVRDGTLYEIHAKRTILATGPHAMKGYHPIDANTGDGFAYGLRVGGRFLDMEFASGGTFSFVWGGYHMGNYNIAVGHGARLVNALGERFMERYDPVRFERSELNRVIAAFVKEIIDGRGPVYLDLTCADDSYWEAIHRARGGKKHIFESGLIPDPRKSPVPVEPGWSVWNGGRGGLQIDLECRTNVRGLFAAGGVSRNDGVGRTGSAGTPTAYAMVSGNRAGRAAAREALADALPVVPASLARELKTRTFAPLRRSPENPMNQIHEEIISIMGSPVDFMVQSASSIQLSLGRLADLRERLSNVGVADVHELVKYHEAVNNIDTFDLMYRCMEDRKESRENFFRSDFPMQDDVNWLCWHTAELTNDGIAHVKQEIPFDRFRYRPENREVKLSSIAAIMSGEFDFRRYENIYNEENFLKVN